MTPNPTSSAPTDRAVEAAMTVIRSRWNFEDDQFDCIENIISDPHCVAAIRALPAARSDDTPTQEQPSWPAYGLCGDALISWCRDFPVSAALEIERLRPPAAGVEPHKLMTREEYDALLIKGWYAVCHDYDGANNTAIRFYSFSAGSDLSRETIERLEMLADHGASSMNLAQEIASDALAEMRRQIEYEPLKHEPACRALSF